MIICVDFDGTCVTHEFPEVGKDIGAAPVLKALTDAGHQLILFTMRGNRHGQRSVLTEAVDWFKRNDIPLWGVNRNPTQRRWTNSPKAYGQLYIDDAALGAPLKGVGIGGRPYVDWQRVEEILNIMGLITTDLRHGDNNTGHH